MRACTPGVARLAPHLQSTESSVGSLPSVVWQVLPAEAPGVRINLTFRARTSVVPPPEGGEGISET